MSNHFTHLHLHTEYSLLDGAIRIPDVVQFAQQQKWQAIGISDHGNIFGGVKFFQECHKAKIKPILGCEMYFTSDVAIKDVNEKYFHLIIIVQNRTGYQNLCRLMSFAYKEGFYFKPRIDYKRLKEFSEGLIVTTTCLGGHIPTLLREEKEAEAIAKAEWFLDVFGPDRFFIEVQPGEYEKQALSNEKLFKFASKMNLQLVATSDSHYLTREDHEAHEVLLSVQTRSLITDPDRYTFGEFRGHLRTTDDMLKSFEHHPDAIWNSGKIADSCDFNFEFGKLHFPNFAIPKEHSEESYFRALCTNGFNKLLEENLIDAAQKDIYVARLEEEMTLIIKMGFIGYFLIVSDFIQWAKRRDIPVGPGRGSVVGSLVAWALEITNVDPLKYNLFFERFLNPERISMPDIDIDFCIEERETVINYVRDTYGHDCVCQIITFGTMMAKGVIKDVARTLGFPFKDAATIADLIPDQLKITIDEAIEQEPRLKEMIESNSQVKHLIDICKRLEGITRHASKHAAGVVISPEPLQNVLPLYIPPKTTDLVAQFAMTELEAIGFLKIDFLGLKNLTLLKRAQQAINKNHGTNLNVDKLPIDDEKTFELLAMGKTDGVFQFESSGIKDVLRKLKPDKFEDLIAVNALYRPGPLGSGMIDDFIERRHGRKKTTYMFKELEPVLSETYGVMVYQEQVMRIASTIAGYTLGGADLLRKAMGKKKADVMDEQKAIFTKGAVELGFDEKKAKELFDLMAYFAGYGFNKAHSTAYALIAYQTAYLKAHYPHEFMAMLVSFETNNPDKMTQYLQEISDMGMTTEPPNINTSEIEFSARDGKILFGLQGIKNVGLAALEVIIKTRQEKPFFDLLDFCTRVDLRTVNKRVIESLIATGAMDCFAGNRAQKTNELEKIMSVALEKKEASLTGQTSLFGAAEPKTSAEKAYEFEPCDDWTDKEKLEKEKELAGFYLSSHPLNAYMPLFKFLKLSTCSDLVAQSDKLLTEQKEIVVTCAGFMQSYRTILTKKGDQMAFVQLEDFTGNCEIIVFPKVFKKIESLLSSHNVFIVKGKLDIGSSSQKPKILADEFIVADGIFAHRNSVKALAITMPESVDESLCQTIKETLGKGNARLELVFKENEKRLKIHAKQTFGCSLDALKTLEAYNLELKAEL
jgi:DNA polymerase-3 subunit alpha